MVPTSERRPVRSYPEDWVLFKGEAWVIMARQLAEYIGRGGADGLPRHLLLYAANLKSAPEHYFASVRSSADVERPPPVPSTAAAAAECDAKPLPDRLHATAPDSTAPS